MTYPTDDLGHPQVDFVWGNFPLQPNDERGENTLDYSLDNHVIAEIGWSNYPAYIPNYSGDEDADLEYVVPDLVRVTRSAAEALLQNHNTDLNLFDTGHNLGIGAVVTTGKTVRIYGYDSNSWNDGQGALNGLRVGDELYLTDLAIDGTDPAPDFGTVKVTKVNDQGESNETYFEFEVETAIEPAIEAAASGSVWAGPNLVNVITLQRFWNPAGSIKQPGTNVHVRYFSQD
jgi:hypothetical protein